MRMKTMLLQSMEMPIMPFRSNVCSGRECEAGVFLGTAEEENR
ncbi:MAG: hypothetical protein ACLT5G_14915 [Blautia wexlerae]